MYSYTSPNELSEFYLTTFTDCVLVSTFCQNCLMGELMYYKDLSLRKRDFGREPWSSGNGRRFVP